MAFDAFLMIEGIDGESKDDKHKNEIDVVSFNWGTSQPGLANGAPASRDRNVSVSEISIVKHVDAATPKLLASSCAGATIPSAVLTVRKPADNQSGSLEFLKIKMSDVMISSIAAEGNTQTEPMPLEQLSLNFSKVELTYASDSVGTLTGACGAGFQKADLSTGG